MEINNSRDYIHFKNDVLKDIHGLDKRLSEQIKIKNKSYDAILCDFKERLEKIEKDNKVSNLNIFEIKSKINQFNELFTYKQNIDNTIYSQEMRIKITMEEVYRLKSKYEKIINDNLIIPGLIGGSFRFKNLKDYIQFLSMEMSRVKSWQEEHKKLDLEFKKKIDNIPVNMVTMLDSAAKQNKEYNEQRQKENAEYLENKIEEFNDRIKEIKNEYLESIKNYEEKLNEQINSFISIKNDILSEVDDKINKARNKGLTKDKEKIKKIIKEINELKNRREKRDEQVINNTKSINEIKNKIKRMNILGYYSKEKNSKISHSNNNLINIEKQLNDNKNWNIQTLSAKRKEKNMSLNNISASSENQINKTNSYIINQNDKNEININHKSNTDRNSKSKIKAKVSYFNPNRSRSNSMAEEGQKINNKINNEKAVKQLLINNSDKFLSSLSSQSLEDIKSNNININEKKNKIQNLVEEEKYYFDKLENKHNLNNNEEFELNEFKSNLKNSKEIFKVNNTDRAENISKSINFKVSKFNKNNDINNLINFNIIKNSKLNNENINKDNIDIDKRKNNENINNKNIINHSKNHNNTKLNTNPTISDYKFKKAGDLYNDNDNDKYNINNYFNSQKLFNLEIINSSSLPNSKNKNMEKRNKTIFLNNYTSRNINRKLIECRNSENDIKINKVDLFSKSKKHINESNKKQQKSFSGKKFIHKTKEKPEETSQVDYLYKLYFNKKKKEPILSSEKTLNNLKKITPIFGRTAYTFYNKGENLNKI